MNKPLQQSPSYSNTTIAKRDFQLLINHILRDLRTGDSIVFGTLQKIDRQLKKINKESKGDIHAGLVYIEGIINEEKSRSLCLGVVHILNHGNILDFINRDEDIVALVAFLQKHNISQDSVYRLLLMIVGPYFKNRFSSYELDKSLGRILEDKKRNSRWFRPNASLIKAENIQKAVISIVDHYRSLGVDFDHLEHKSRFYDQILSYLLQVISLSNDGVISLDEMENIKQLFVGYGSSIGNSVVIQGRYNRCLSELKNNKRLN